MSDCAEHLTEGKNKRAAINPPANRNTLIPILVLITEIQSVRIIAQHSETSSASRSVRLRIFSTAPGRNNRDAENQTRTLMSRRRRSQRHRARPAPRAQKKRNTGGENIGSVAL